jgi:hypothetical protein
LKVPGPIVRGLSVAFGVILGRLPKVPVSVRVILGLARFFEPLMLITCMVDDEIEDELHAALVKLVFEYVDVADIAVWRVDYLVITDIISLA